MLVSSSPTPTAVVGCLKFGKFFSELDAAGKRLGKCAHFFWIVGGMIPHRSAIILRGNHRLKGLDKTGKSKGGSHYE